MNSFILSKVLASMPVIIAPPTFSWECDNIYQLIGHILIYLAIIGLCVCGLLIFQKFHGNAEDNWGKSLLISIAVAFVFMFAGVSLNSYGATIAVAEETEISETVETTAEPQAYTASSEMYNIDEDLN